MARIGSKRSMKQACADLKAGDERLLADLDHLMDDEQVREYGKAYKSLKALWDKAVNTYDDIELLEKEIDHFQERPQPEEVDYVIRRLMAIANAMTAHGEELDRIADQDFTGPPGPAPA